jgi:hypothetical protein
VLIRSSRKLPRTDDSSQQKLKVNIGLLLSPNCRSPGQRDVTTN